MTKTIDQFSTIELTPEFSAGSDAVLVKSVEKDIRSGISLDPNGVGPVGLTFYNNESKTDYGFANLMLHPEIPDTLILNSRSVGTGTKPTKMKSYLSLSTLLGEGTTLQNQLGIIDLNNVFDRLKEPTGFAERTTTILSFDDLSRTLTITPTNESFKFYIYGVEFVKTTSQVTIPDSEGTHFIYFNQSGILSSTMIWDASLITDTAMVSIIYWDATNNKAIYVADERHTSFMQGTTHLYLHTNFGALYHSGLSLSNLTTDGNGSSNSHATIGVDNGSFSDEDITITISHGLPQQLTSVAQIPVYYRVGANNWRKDVATNYPLKMGSSLPAYNNYSGGVWSQADVSNNNFVLSHIFATNDINNPIIAIQGIAQYATITLAREASHVEINSVTNIPIQEFVPIATLIYQCANSYSNEVKARIRKHEVGEDYVDWRTSFNRVTVAGAGNSSEIGDIALSVVGDVTHEITGFRNLTSGSPLKTGEGGSTLSWDDSTRTVTVAPTGTSFSFYNNGVKFTKFGPVSVQISTADGSHFIYFDNNGNLIDSTTPWDLMDTVQICYVYWNNSLGKGIAYEERHGVSMDGATHAYLHTTRGTQYISGMTLGNYVVSPGSPANSDNNFSISTGVLADEDLRTTLTAVSSGSYTILKRGGASGIWRWDASADPYAVSSGSFAINVFSGGEWTDAPITGNNFANIYIIGVPSLTSSLQYVIIPSQFEHTTLSSAQSEGIQSLSLGNVPFQENILLCQITFQRSDSYTTSGKVRIAATPVTIRNNLSFSIVGSSGGQSDQHNSLNGLQGGTSNEYYHLSLSEKTKVEGIFSPTASEGWFLVSDGSGGTDWAAKVNKNQTFTATANQTVFNLTSFTYPLGVKALKVYINGVRQSNDDFIETDTDTITFITACEVNDVVLIEMDGMVTTTGGVLSVNGYTGSVTLTKSDLTLGNVDNTSDLNKPISTATQTALNGKEASITIGTTSQYWRGDKSWQTLDKSTINLGNVENIAVSTWTGPSITSSFQIASGTTAQRPSSSPGKIRFNTDTNKYEGGNNSTWGPITAASGGGADDIFYENGQIITTNYTITTGKNAMSAGPISINNGIIVSVPENSTWTIV